MSKILELNLDPNYEKPIFYLDKKVGEEITCLLDSGASIPIWCGNQNKFHRLFKDAELSDKKALLTGFGNGKNISYADVVHDLYRIPEFYLADEHQNSILIYNMIIIMEHSRNFGCELILGSSLFHGQFDYSILSRKNNNKLIIEYDNQEYIMFVKDSPYGYVKSAYTGKVIKSN